MKTMWQVIAILAVLHVAAALAVIGWLMGTQRISRDRVVAMRDTFMLTVPEELEHKKKRDEAQAAATEQAQRVMALQGAGSGPETVAQKLAQEQQKTEIAQRQLERAREELDAMRRNLQLSQQRVEQQRKEAVAEKQSLEKRLADIEKQLNDTGFKKAVAMYEALPARQVKDMFLQMLSAGKTDDVVAYLEAMQPRKAGGVLKEFKTAEEVARAVELTQRLRERGSELVKQLESVG